MCMAGYCYRGSTMRAKSIANKSSPLAIRQRMVRRIKRSKGNVFLREDFKHLGSYDAVGRHLKALCQEEVLIRLGYGVYARASYNSYAKKALPICGLRTVYEAVERLGVKIGQSKATRDYNTARSRQVPNGRVIAVSKPITRQLGYGGVTLYYEWVKDEAQLADINDWRAAT